jgi:hypothetical protein
MSGAPRVLDQRPLYFTCGRVLALALALASASVYVCALAAEWESALAWELALELACLPTRSATEPLHWGCPTHYTGPIP